MKSGSFPKHELAMVSRRIGVGVGVGVARSMFF